MPQVAVVIPAYNEADRVAATVTAAKALPGVDVVVVVDDGSRDATAAVARQAGARALRYARNHGKAMAMIVGAREVAEIDRRRPVVQSDENNFHLNSGCIRSEVSVEVR